MKIAIIGSGVEAFSCGHRLLDINPSLNIHIFDKKAESGMYGEEPGIYSDWPIIPDKWSGNLYSQTPNKFSSAIRYSWFVKSISISLADRGVYLHLKSVVKSIRHNTVEYYGAGFSGAGKMDFDKIIDLRNMDEGALWFGGVTISKTNEKIFGIRPDNTIEIWSKKPSLGDNLVQRMEWRGENPRSALADRINAGINAAETSLSE